MPGTPAKDLTLSEAARKLGGGAVGTTVTLTLRAAKADSADGAASRDVALSRQEVPVKPRPGASSFDGPAGGLYAGTVGAKPPPALWLAMQGMREGGRRTVLVPSDVGCVRTVCCRTEPIV